jgi:hypothetical protein
VVPPEEVLRIESLLDLPQALGIPAERCPQTLLALVVTEEVQVHAGGCILAELRMAFPRSGDALLILRRPLGAPAKRHDEAGIGAGNAVASGKGSPMSTQLLRT